MAVVEDKRFQTIKNLPLVGIRTILFKKLFSGDLSETELQDIKKKLRALVPSNQLVVFEQEERNIEEALKNGTTPAEPNLATPELQLLWAAHLIELSKKSDKPLHQTALWKQLINSSQAQFELEKHAGYVAQDLVNPDTVIYWSEPRTLFAYQPSNNLIHIDFLSSLILGFEDTRSIIFHEIGHSRITRGVTGAMRENDEEAEALRAKGKLTDAESERLLTLYTERKFLHSIWDEAENNAVDRYAINRSHNMAQDFGRSMNNVETIFVQWQPHEPSNPPTATDRYFNLKQAIRMCVYKNNGFFDDTKEGWESVGVHPELITALPKIPGQPAPSSEEAFKELVDLCSGEKGLENLQPGVTDRMKGPQWLERVTDDYARQRNEIVDEIWTRFAAPIVKELMPDAIERSRQEQQQQDKQGSGNQKPQEGKGEAIPEGPPPPKSRSGKPENKPKNNDNPESEKDEVVPESASTPKPEAINPETKPDNAETIGSLLGDDKDKNRSRGQQGLPEGPPLPDMVRSDPSGGISSVPPTPIIGDWKDYNACVAQFANEIRDARILLTNIQKRQTQLINRPSHTHSLLPEDGDTTRFDPSAHRALITKILTGRDVSEQDVKRFSEDAKKKIPAPIDIVILIDGSGSMYSDHDNKYNKWPFAPIQIGLQTACILNEAAKGLNINVHIGLWGNNPPLMIVKPGDDPIKIGQAIAGIKNSQGWGTSLAPAVTHTVKELSTQKVSPTSSIGHTHFIVVSDGDISDQAAAKTTLEHLFHHCKQVTFDVAVIQKGETEMDKTIMEMQKKYSSGRVGLKHCDTPAVAHQAIFDLLRDRMQETGYSQAIPARLKQKALGTAYRHM